MSNICLICNGRPGLRYTQAHIWLLDTSIHEASAVHLGRWLLISRVRAVRAPVVVIPAACWSCSNESVKLIRQLLPGIALSTPTFSDLLISPLLSSLDAPQDLHHVLFIFKDFR